MSRQPLWWQLAERRCIEVKFAHEEISTMADQEREGEENPSKVLSEVSSDRRDFLRKAAGMGFAVPVVASFSMSGLMAGPAYASGNLSL